MFHRDADELYRLYDGPNAVVGGIVLNIGRSVNRLAWGFFPKEISSDTLAGRMLESRPPQRMGTIFGLALIAGLLLVDLGFLILLLSQPVSAMSFLWAGVILASMPAMAFLAFWVSGLAATRYHVEDNVLVIEWGRIRQVVPLEQIHALVMGETLKEVRDFKGIRWPGYFVGHGRVMAEEPSVNDRQVLFFATRPLNRQLVVTTESNAYALSPVDLDNFADCLEALRIPQQEIGGDLPETDVSFLGWAIWNDRVAQLVIAIAICLNAAQFAYLGIIFGLLPSLVPVHFNFQGMVDRVTSPASLFVLPFVGLVAWIVDGALGWIFYQYREERAVGFLLWGGASLVQLITWIALLGLLATAV